MKIIKFIRELFIATFHVVLSLAYTVQRYKKDRRDMESKYQIQIQTLEKSLSETQTKSNTERDQLQMSIEREREHLQLERHEMQKQFEEEREQLQLQRTMVTGWQMDMVVACRLPHISFDNR